MKNVILILTDWYLPGYKAGGPIRSLANLVTTLENTFDINIITSDSDLNSSQPYESIEPDKWLNICKSKIIYLSKSNKAIRRIKELILEVNPDVIYLNSMYSAYFTVYPLIASIVLKKKYKVILAPRGMLQKGALHLKNNKKKLFLFIFKLFVLDRKIIFHATDEQEKEDVIKQFPSYKAVAVISNFVNLPVKAERNNQKKGGYLRLVYISVISSKKNLSYLPFVFSNVHEKIIFDVYGPIKDKKYWGSFLEKIKGVQNITFNYKGDLPNNLVQKTLAEYDFFILPTLGENFGHAIYEALSTGTPVIISNKTPWRNLEEKKAGWDIPLAEPEKFVEVLNKCAAMDQEEYEEWSKGAHNFAIKYYEENDPTEKYLEMFGWKG